LPASRWSLIGGGKPQGSRDSHKPLNESSFTNAPRNYSILLFLSNPVKSFSRKKERKEKERTGDLLVGGIPKGAEHKQKKEKTKQKERKVLGRE